MDDGCPSGTPPAFVATRRLQPSGSPDQPNTVWSGPSGPAARAGKATCFTARLVPTSGHGATALLHTPQLSGAEASRAFAARRDRAPGSRHPGAAASLSCRRPAAPALAWSFCVAKLVPRSVLCSSQRSCGSARPRPLPPPGPAVAAASVSRATRSTRHSLQNVPCCFLRRGVPPTAFPGFLPPRKRWLR